MQATVVLAAEDNRTGPFAAALVASLRRWGGALSDAPVVVISPRGRHLDPAVHDELTALGARIVVDHLNVDFGDAGWANKPFALAWAERHVDTERLILTDADAVFLGPADELASPSFDLGLTPVWATGIGSRGPGDPADRLWSTACGRPLPAPTMTTVVTGDRIRPYFNSGLIAADVRLGLFGRWADTYRRLADDVHVADLLSRPGNVDVYSSPSTFLDQLALSVAIIEGGLDPTLLGPGLNLPLNYLSSIEPTPDPLVHGQHLGYLGWEGFAEVWLDGAEDDPRSTWLRERSQQVADESLEWPPTFLDRFDATFDTWRLELSEQAEAAHEH